MHTYAFAVYFSHTHTCIPELLVRQNIAFIVRIGTQWMFFQEDSLFMFFFNFYIRMTEGLIKVSVGSLGKIVKKNKKKQLPNRSPV